MPKVKNRQFETFEDGLLTICDTDERKLTQNKMEHIRFGNRTAGVQRYWQAKTAGNKVDRLLSVPLSVLKVITIETQDVVIVETDKIANSVNQYQIIQVQPKYDTQPPALYLSLEKVVHPFKDGRSVDGEN